MARNVTIQVLRGTQANIQSAIPLALGEIYFATDTGNLFFGTPGIGVGYIQIGDTTKVNDTLLKVLLELKAIRLALTALACEGGKNEPSDFNPFQIAADPELTANDV